MESRQLLSVTPSMVVDANDADGFQGLWREQLTAVGDSLFFGANHAELGAGLWRSDGTPAGTVLMKQIPSPGLYAVVPRYLTNVGGTLFFWTKSGGLSTLWRSDGTEAGTEAIKQIEPQIIGAPPGVYFSRGELNEEYYFAANDGASGFELWKSDGTIGGTVQVVDLRPGVVGSAPQILSEVNGVLYFAADSDGTGLEIWSTDGTTSGTVQVAELPGTSKYLGSATTVGNRLFFTYNDGTHGSELWSSDGTMAGTALVKDIRPSASGGYGGYVQQLVNLNGVLYFSARQASHTEMWRSDGTETGTQPVFSTWVPSPTQMTNIDGTLFFARGGELWKSNGSAASAVRIAKPSDYSIHGFYNAGGILYFSTSPSYSSNVQKLWKSDGTPEGTKPIKEFPGGFKHPFYTGMAAIGEALYFVADDPINGQEQLWKTEEGTDAGVEILNNLHSGTQSGSPTNFTVVGDWMYFISSSSTHWTSLWKTDGTNAVLVKNLRPAPTEHYARQPNEMTNVDGTLYFVATDGEHGYELWKSDGTPEGTLMVKDINVTYQGISSDPPIKLTNVNGELFFFASSGGGYYEPWKSDGTASGTEKLFFPSSGIQHLASFQNELVYSTYPFLTSTLWKTDGTYEGTSRISPANVSLDGSYGAELEVTGDLIYFVANDGAAGMELWKSDGTASGSKMVKDITPGAASSFIGNLTNVNGHLYFTMGGYAKQLWRTDGTAAGTVQIAALPVQSSYSFDAKVIEFEGSIYFTAGGGSTLDSKIILWKSDGTSSTPTLVAEFEGDYFWKRQLTVIDDQLYLIAQEIDGRTYLTSVGDSSTEPELQLLPNSRTSMESEFVTFKSNIYMSASDGAHGYELWKVFGPDATPGDFTDDGTVDGADFLAWQRDFASSVVPNGGGADGDANGIVGGGDLDVWLDSYGVPQSSSAHSAVAAVPMSALVTEEEVVGGEQVLDDAMFESGILQVPATALRTGDFGSPVLGWSRPVEGGGVEWRRDAARDALFAAGDFSRLFMMGDDAHDGWLKRRRGGWGR